MTNVATADRITIPKQALQQTTKRHQTMTNSPTNPTHQAPNPAKTSPKKEQPLDPNANSHRPNHLAIQAKGVKGSNYSCYTSKGEN
ncbi:hypothetical protein BDV35DRAFT_344018 [Aspergillus flavus]|nr:hypothetical protein BDV35DRAFT_344018 [Aspergillus flavus]